MRQDFDAALRVGVADSSGRRPTLRRALVSGQVALTLLLLIGSGLFVTSLRHVQGIDLGIEASHLVYANVDLASRGMAAPDANARYATMLTKVRQLPGVQSASLSAGEPLASGWAISLQARDAEPPKPGEMTPFGQAVGSGYFETMGATLRAGRFFTEIDQSPVARVAIIDEATAQHFWPHGDALGACARLGSDGDCTAIVGIIANTVRWQVTGDRGFTVYVPLESKFAHRVSMMEIRTDRDPAELVSSIRRAMQSTAPDMPFADIQPVSRRLAPQIRPWQLGAAMFSVYGALALVLASIGLYGLLSFMVSQRTREIGLRRALGAPERSVVALVVRSAAGMTIVGVLVGAIAAIPAGRLVASELYGISPHDVRVFALGAAVLTVVGLLASFIPARRAARIDPMDALRAD
jgi:predicted permease